MIGEAVDRATDRVSERVNEIVQSYVWKVVFSIIAVALLTGAIVCGCIALFWVLSPQYGALPAIGMIAAGMVILAAIFSFAALRSGREVTISGTVQPVRVVEEEADEVVDTVGPYKFVAAALAAGALVGGSLAGSGGSGARDNRGSSNRSSMASSALEMVPSLLSVFAMISNTRGNEDKSEMGTGRSDVPT